MNATRNADAIPRVFISSTVEDLRAYREAAKEAALGAELLPRMLEYFPASGDRLPVDCCLQEVADCDLTIVIVAHRYGWIPTGQTPGEAKSITRLEVDQAIACGQEVLAFLVDDKQPWPEDQREESSLLAAIRAGKATGRQLKAVQENVERLKDFKDWLSGRNIRAFFTTPEHLRRLVSEALSGWRKRNMAPAAAQLHLAPSDPTRYLESLREQTSHIDIRGLQVGTGRVHRFPIEDLFISLTTAARPLPKDETDADDPERIASRLAESCAALPLQAALQHDRLLVVGDPGMGKTTFVRRVAYALCQTRLGETPDAAQTRLGVADRTFPVLLRLNELAQHLGRCRTQAGAPATATAAAWLPYFLAAVSADSSWGLDETFFRRQLEGGLCTVLLDGLDEAPDRIIREQLCTLIDQAAMAYRGCRWVVTSRPAANAGAAVLPTFTHAEIDPLSDAAIETFLSRWCAALYADSPDSASQHLAELLEALRARPDIRRMARNPVMLTALAVVHWNERRLPEQRAELYESIIRWLSRSREQRPGREKAERTVQLLQELALAMQNHPEGLRTQVPKRWAAERLAPAWAAGGQSATDAIDTAQQFLEAEELDSGIVVARGSELQFWHRTFQEFLAARAIAGRTDEGQRQLLWGPPPRLYAPEWREVVLLLSGILHQHGPDKVDALVGSLIAEVWPDGELAAQARCVGLLGAILRDLTPLAYEVKHAVYPDLRHRVLAIFDRQRSPSVPIEVRIAAADALGQTGDPQMDHRRADYWIEIPAGEFWMGAQKKDPQQRNFDSEAYDDQWDESPVHAVPLETFQIARYPITVGQFQQFFDHGGYEQPRWWDSAVFGQFKEPNDWDKQLPFPSRPVTGVSWHEASAFAAWLGCRLPTEAEWERAARGTDGRKYPWGSEPANETRLNFAGKIGHVTPVGIYPLGNTPEEISELAGNVWEWCADWYGKYEDAIEHNPRGPDKGSARVLRGGSWRYHARDCRSACRSRRDPGVRSQRFGFRVAAVQSR
ncbi:MAG: SUMF1/EgtB/PvdO family nonheme iron enzyme [Planctomycetota bacterium]|nr:SUMF1/EgtB/PvdO family nonheme iron enzyme [Planctomycetota bacterium]